MVKVTETFNYCSPFSQISQASHLEITLVETVPAPLLGNESRRLEVNEEIEGNCVFLATQD
jgi:hypothetical protein